MTLTVVSVEVPIGLVSEAILHHLHDCLPEEAVGIIWSDGTVTRLVNQARSSERFSVGTTQLAEAFAEVDPEVKTIAAFYHTHPGGSLDLSSTDREAVNLQHASGVSIPWVVMTPNGSYSMHIFAPEPQVTYTYAN